MEALSPYRVKAASIILEANIGAGEGCGGDAEEPMATLWHILMRAEAEIFFQQTRGTIQTQRWPETE